MRVLVLDTSTPAVTVGLVEVGEQVCVLAERVVLDARRHGELLAVGLAEVLAGEPAAPGRRIDGEPAAPGRRIDAVVVGVGPGPFTGLRVGIVTAAAFADARELPVLGVCSLDGLSAPHTGVVTDARRREVYWARYDGDGLRVDGPHVGAPPVAARALAGAGRIVGDGARLYPDVFAGAGDPRHPSAARLAEVAVRAQQAGRATLPLTAQYLRRPDAQQPQAPKRVTR